MHGEDDNRGFKGLGKLAASQPPPVPGQAAAPPAAGSGAPTPPLAPPPQDPPPGPPSRPHAGQIPTPPPQPTGPKPGNSGCAKVVLFIVLLVVVLGTAMVFLLRWIAPAPDPSTETAVDYAAPAAAMDPELQAQAEAMLAAEQARAAAEAERIAACRAGMGTPPYTGEVLQRDLGEGGHTLKVNAGTSDGLIKLKQDGRTVLSFYVSAHESAEVSDIPDGTYQVMFAGGSEFSRGCGEFLVDMSVSADPDPLVMAPMVEDGATYYALMEYTLTRQAGGNFEPETLDPDAFRD